MSALEDERAYTLWSARKSTKLRRPTLDCGHPNLGEVSIHLWCDFLPCPSCADVDHDCAAFGGAKDKSGTEKGPETVEAAAPVPLVQCDTSPWVSFAAVAAGPSAGTTEAVDLRRRVQDGTAPAPDGPDRVADAFRAEVLRQGLTDCEIDGVRWVYGGGQLSKSPYQPEPVPPLVDAAVEPDRPRRQTFGERMRARGRADGPGINEPPFPCSFNLPDPPPKPVRLPWWKRRPW